MPSTRSRCCPSTPRARRADTEYLSDGITETVINALGQLTGLKVMARSTVFRYKGEDPREVGLKLGVRVVLTGRLFQRGETLVIGAELVEVESGAQVWGQQYRRQMTDIFDLQEEIARAISDQLRVKLTSEDDDRLGKRYTDDRYAYEAYLRGRYCWNQRSLAGMRASVEHFRSAIDRDPLYALAYAGLGDALAMIGIYHGAAPADSFPKAEVAARRALEIDADLAEAIATLGFVEFCHGWDQEAAAATLREAIRRKPAYPSAHQWLSACLALAGDFDAALAESKLALDLDPFSASINTSAAWPLLWGRRNDEAVERLSDAVELHPSYWTAHYYLGLAHHQRGDSDRAIAALEKARSLSDSTWGSDALAYAYAMAGRRAEAEAVLAEAAGSRVERVRLAVQLRGGRGRIGRPRSRLRIAPCRDRRPVLENRLSRCRCLFRRDAVGSSLCRAAEPTPGSPP